MSETSFVMAMVCMCIAAAVAMARGRDKTRSRLGSVDLQRFRRISDEMRREEFLPFE